jgi:hypothetical protein
MLTLVLKLDENLPYSTWLSTVDLLVQTTVLLKSKIIFLISKAAILNYLVLEGQPY